MYTTSLIFLLILTSVQSTVCERVYIVTSPSNPCPLEFDEDHCLTLQQYASRSNSTFDSIDNLSLELEPGNHNLDSPIRVFGGNSFVLKAVNDTVQVACSRNEGHVIGMISTRQIQYVHISGITFVGCDRNGVFDTTELLIEDVHFELSRESALSISRTINATILRSSFSDFMCFCPAGSLCFCSIYALSVTGSSLQLKSCSFSNGPLVSQGGGINVDDSDIIVENSLFRNISGRFGGSMTIRNSRDRTLEIINSTFLDNTASRQGGAIYVSRSDITLEGCKFINNTVTTDPAGGALFAIGINISVSIRQSYFSNNMASGVGGAVAITDGIVSLPHIIDILYPYTRNSISIHQSQFTYNRAENGGAIVVTGRRSSVTLTQSSFIGNTAFSGGGGAVLVSGINSSIFIDQSDFTTNEADDEGGAVEISGDGSLITVNTCTFSNNIAHRGSGGAISHYRGNILINDSIFNGNNASYCGALDVVQATVTSTIFSRNRATTGPRSTNTWKTRGGGAICVRDSSTSLLSSTFNHNSAEESNAGALNTFSGLRIEGCSFNNNKAGQDGGAILHHGGADLTVIQSNFSNNQAAGDGGVVHGVSMSIDEVNFYNNTAEFGGSLYVDQAVIFEGNFINNRATVDGGAVFLSCTFCGILAASLQRCNFFNNAASQGVGGAIFIKRHNVSLMENIFSNNSASSCGALGASWRINFRPFRLYNLNISRSTFTHNTATGVDRNRIGGGGAMCLKSGTVSVVDSSYTHNTAIENGGVMEVDNSTMLIEGSTFDNNTARGDGGVAHTGFGYLSATFEVFQSSFTNNQATRGDGGVFNIEIEGSKILVSEGSLGHNRARVDGGVFNIEGVSLTVNDTSVYGNVALRGNTVSACDSNITISSSGIYNISQRAQTENCFFYDLVSHPTVEPSTTVPPSFSTGSTTITSVNTAATSTSTQAPSEVNTISPSRASTVAPSEVNTISPSRASTVAPSEVITPFNAVSPSKLTSAITSSSTSQTDVSTTASGSSSVSSTVAVTATNTPSTSESVTSTTPPIDATSSEVNPTNNAMNIHTNFSMVIFLCTFIICLSCTASY